MLQVAPAPTSNRTSAAPSARVTAVTTTLRFVKSSCVISGASCCAARARHCIVLDHTTREESGSMDVEQETWKLKVMLFVIVVFIVSAFVSCSELKYATSGKKTEAVIDRVSDVISRRGSRGRMVVYHFHDERGQLRKSSDTVSRDSVGLHDEKIDVEYLEDTSRVAGHRNMVAVVIFFGCLAALLVGG